MAEAYGTGRTDFRFRGLDFHFLLSHGLFSAAGVDAGTRLLLKVLSNQWDDDLSAGRPLPRAVLDAGCGAGIIGVCAAGALNAAAGGTAPWFVRAQDRDELARAFTDFNARQNRIPPARLSAHTEPLLAGPPDSRWDLILSNIPAKAGNKVLADFVSRSAALLNPGGAVLMVAVNPLADMFRSRIKALGLALLREEAGGGHTVFMYAPPENAPGNGAVPGADPAKGPGGPVQGRPLFPAAYPAYRRGEGDYELEGIGCHIQAIEGVRGFDNPGDGVRAAAKLARRLAPRCPPEGAILVHEPDQGHFPAWLGGFLGLGPECRMALSGRNILALENARRNIPVLREIGIFPAPDLAFVRDEAGAFAGEGYHLIAAFPDLVPQTDRLGAYWEGLADLAADAGIVIVSLPSGAAERFDRLKPRGFTRLGDIRRKGFRALGYKKNPGAAPGTSVSGTAPGKH
jgi:hypothetical protein